jgi:hypothetical protein
MAATANVTVDNLIQAGLTRAPLPIERDYKGVHLTGIRIPIGWHGHIVALAAHVNPAGVDMNDGQPGISRG